MKRDSAKSNFDKNNLTQEQNILLKITQSLIGTLDFQKVLQIISDGMSELLEIETAAIYLLEEDKKLYLGATTPPLDPQMPDALRIAHVKEHPHIQKSITTRHSQIIADTRTEILSEAEKIVVELRNLRSILYFPFIQKEKVLGVLILGTSNKSRIFAKPEIDLGQTVANQLSIGIQNAWLHLDLQTKNRRLKEEISERIKVEQDLRKSEGHLSNALRIAKLGHWEYDIENDLFTFTDEFYEIYYTSAEKIGGYTMNAEQYAKMFVYPDDIQVVNSEIQKSIETDDPGFSAEVEHRVQFKNGQLGHIIVRYKVIKDQHGKTIKILGVNQDITLRKLADQSLIQAKIKLEESEYRYRSLFSQAAEGILLMTKEGEVVQANESFANMHGYSHKEIMKINITDLDVLKERTFSDRQEILTKLMKGEVVQMEVKHFHKNGHIFPLNVITQILHLDDIDYILSFHQDLTKQKEYERELKEHRDHLAELVKEKTKELDKAIMELRSVNEELSNKNKIINGQNTELKATLENLQDTQAKLIQAEKMASLGILTAGVAHEINNPLNFIMGSYVGLDKFFNKVAPEHKEYVQVLLDGLKSGVDRASNIVKGLNQFSRDSKTYYEDCDIHSIIDNCFVITRNQYKNNISIKKSYENDNLVIKGNVGKLHQVFINILTNSIQSIENTGIITISTKKLKDVILIKIKDNGCGIKKENLKKITDPFFTTKEPNKGTGLGLSIAYKIVQEHKGHIEFESKINKGTTVLLTLPLTI